VAAVIRPAWPPCWKSTRNNSRQAQRIPGPDAPRPRSGKKKFPRSNSSSVSRGPCATRLHKRNAASPRCPCPKRSGHKAIPCCLCSHAAQIRALGRPPGDFPRNAAVLVITKAIRCFVHSGCTNSGLRRSPGILPESVCVPESPRVLPPVCDCSGFAISDYVRFLFAKCQTPFCSVGLHLRPDLLFRCLTHRACAEGLVSVTGTV